MYVTWLSKRLRSQTPPATSWTAAGARLLEPAAVPELCRTDGTWHVARLSPAYGLGQIRSGRGPLMAAAVADHEQVGHR
ncbi:hypothetical protein ACU635_61060 [[Actinomadura] parvosata]|uniref:hypothetical protein n=1 Tax=[Actinomadura] parvosata TaxID=1955412 RepID=UPI00406C10F5